MTANWSAAWIWNGLPEYTSNVYLEARKAFVIERQVVTAKLRISACQLYIVYVNGFEVGRGPAPSDTEWTYFDDYEVGRHLKQGENAIAVVVYNFGCKDIVTEQFQGPGGLIAQLDIITPNETVSIHTDGTWKCRLSPRWVQQVSRLHKWNGFREIYLADREDGWENAHYDDSRWEQGRVIASPEQDNAIWPRLLPRDIPPLEIEKVFPKTVVRTDMNYGRITGQHNLLFEPESGIERERGMTADASVPGSLPGVLYDYGREIAGYLRLCIDAPEGGVVQLSFGESLELSLMNTFILKKGRNELLTFGRRAFRYLQLSFMATSKPVFVRKLETEFTHYPFGPAGTFACSDPLLDRIWEVGVYTSLVNSQNHIEDCPLREQALWVADAVIIGKVIYHTFGDTLLPKKCLTQIARIQNPDGSIPGTGPERNGHLLPDFCMHWLFGVYTHWKYSGDTPFLTDLWPNIVRLLDWFQAQEDESGLFSGADRSGWWCFIDWADYIDRRDRVTAVNCFYYKALTLVAEMGRALGEASLPEQLLKRAEKLRNAIRSQLWLPGKLAFADCLTDEGLSPSLTAQTNFTAIWSGLMEEEEADRFLDGLYFKGLTPPLKGGFFYHIVLETLLQRGRNREALRIIRAYWGEMLERGATTWWETFDPSTPRCTVPSPYQGNTPTYLRDDVPVSFCHGWGASPTYLLTRHVLGVDVLDFGSGVVHLAPAVDGLDWAKGEIPTPWGPIRVHWSRRPDGSVAYKAEIPEQIRWTVQALNDIGYEINGCGLAARTDTDEGR